MEERKDNVTDIVHKIRARQNDIMMAGLLKANAAVSHLTEDGFTVISVVVESNAPLIYIQNSRHCAKLKSAVRVTRGTSSGVVKEMVATVKNCQVRWTVHP